MFGSILQTHMPFMTHVTRCPVLPVSLLCAAIVDVADDCRMLICDEWLQFSFEDPEEAICLLEDAALLRRAIHRALDQQIVDLFEADCDDDVFFEDLAGPDSAALPAAAPARLLRALWSSGVEAAQLRGKDLEDRALALWHRRAQCRWQTLMPNEYVAFREASGKGATTNAQTSGPFCWLRFGTVLDDLKPDSSLVSDHLAVAWQCPRCRHTFRFTRRDIGQHTSQCDGDGADGHTQPTTAEEVCGEGRGQPAANAAMARPSQETSADQPPAIGWRCDECGSTLPVGCSALDILRHRRSHGL